MQEADRFIATVQVEQGTQAFAAFAGQFGVALYHIGGVLAGDFQEIGMRLEAGNAEAGRAGLSGAEKLPFAAQLQILFGDQEAVLAIAQDRQTRPTVFAEGPLVEQNTG